MPIRTLCLLSVLILAGCATSAPPRPNVIVIVIDTLRPDVLELYGAEGETAPYLARLGARSAVFLDAWSSSTWTAPATASLFTGQYPLRHGVTLGFHAHGRTVREVEAAGEAPITINQLPEDRPTLPSAFARLDYRTFGLASNVNIGSEIGFDRGFDRFLHLNHASARELEARLEEWETEMRAASPFLLYLHLNDVHAPYDPRSPWYAPQGEEREDLRAAYRSEVRYVDDVLERVVDRLDPDGEALILVASDHGEEFWEHGHGKHTHSLHYELGRILLVVHGPSLGVRPARLSDNVSIVDVLPTLLDLLQAPIPEDLDGISLAPLMRGGLAAARQRRQLAVRPLFAHRVSPIHDYELRGVVQGNWHLIDDGRNARLYDLERDTLERNDVAEANPRVEAALREALAGHTAQPGAAHGGLEVRLDRDDVEHLRALGYVDE